MPTNTEIQNIIQRALKEDAYRNDVTTKLLISSSSKSKAQIIAKEAAVVCGLDVAIKVFRTLDPTCRFQTKLKDGSRVKKGAVILSIEGKTKALLTAERTALNFLARLSGIATLTNQFMRQCASAKTTIHDTRKTTPGLRLLEKYAVRCGGGENHRMNLAEMVLIKDNHRKLFKENGSLETKIRLIKKKTNKLIEVEVDSLKQFQAALTANPDFILLDNMNLKNLKKAVKLRKKLRSG